MTDDFTDGEQDDPTPGTRSDEQPAERRAPVGAPVVRGDPELAVDRDSDAVAFDPDDPESVERAVETVREFATADGHVDRITMLRGAAACATLVRGAGSYRAASEQAGDAVTVEFLRKWARVHDLPRSVRRYIASGEISPSSAEHVARVTGDARFLLAWSSIDHDLSVEEVRSVASDVTDGTVIEEALRNRGIALGETTVIFRPPVYRELRRQAGLDGVDPGEIVSEAVEAWLASRD